MSIDGTHVAPLLAIIMLLPVPLLLEASTIAVTAVEFRAVSDLLGIFSFLNLLPKLLGFFILILLLPLNLLDSTDSLTDIASLIAKNVFSSKIQASPRPFANIFLYQSLW